MLMAIPTMIVLTSVRKKDLPSVQSRDHSVFAPIDTLSLDCIRQASDTKTSRTDGPYSTACMPWDRSSSTKHCLPKKMSVVEGPVHIWCTSGEIDVLRQLLHCTHARETN